VDAGPWNGTLMSMMVRENRVRRYRTDTNDHPQAHGWIPSGGSRGESQNDLFALVRVGERTLAVTIEGKVDEPFGQLLGAWKANASPSKRQRLTFLCDRLGLPEGIVRLTSG
jgi:hypothetical protein